MINDDYIVRKLALKYNKIDSAIGKAAFVFELFGREGLECATLLDYNLRTKDPERVKCNHCNTLLVEDYRGFCSQCGAPQ
jgi:hypothetical protein